jgi:putative restriction endonuclease
VITPLNPTADVAITADLIVGGRLAATVKCRYQHQTWGGARQPERRLTANLGPLRNEAQAGDIVLFGRDENELLRMRLELVRQSDPGFQELRKATAGRRWGVPSGFDPPPSNSLLSAEKARLRELELQPFSPFTTERRAFNSHARLRARDSAFRVALVDRYGHVCAATGPLIVTNDNASNLDGAHIVPVSAGGTDDPRNGLLLSKDFHWAFDRGLFQITDEYRIRVTRNVLIQGKSESLLAIDGKPLDFGTSRLRPHPEAIAWHRQNVRP